MDAVQERFGPVSVLVNVSSSSAHSGQPFMAHYVAAKAFLGFSTPRPPGHAPELAVLRVAWRRRCRTRGPIAP